MRDSACPQVGRAHTSLTPSPVPAEDLWLESFLRDEAKIKEANLKKYLPLLTENEIDEEVLKRATDEKLEKWGISAGGDRERILAAIGKRLGKRE